MLQWIGGRRVHPSARQSSFVRRPSLQLQQQQHFTRASLTCAASSRSRRGTYLEENGVDEVGSDHAISGEGATVLSHPGDGELFREARADVNREVKTGSPAVQLLRPQVATAPRLAHARSTLPNRKPEEQLVIGQTREVMRSTLHMAQGGVLSDDHTLADGAYLTEMLSEEERRSVWLPNSYSKNIWDVLLALLVSYTAIMLPIELCYDDVLQTQPRHLIIFDIFTDVIFLVDIVINFRVGYIDQAVVVVDKRAIRRKYLGRWFAVDVIGAFPGDSIFAIYQAATKTSNGGGSDSDSGFGRAQASILTLFKVLKVPKIMRLGRVLKSLEKLEGIASVANILILLVIIIFMNHWISCFWFLVAKGEGGWVDAKGLSGLPWTRQYPTIFHTTLTMVMGESVTPELVNNGEYVASSAVIVIGITMNATVFASIASYASQISAEHALHKNRMISIRRSIGALGVPRVLARRIQHYYEYCWTRHRDFAAQDLLDEMPAEFQVRTCLAAHEAKLRAFEPFANADERFIAALATRLRPEVFMPEAFILVAGQVYSEAYFIARGLVQLTWAGNRPDLANELILDDYFGEFSLFLRKKLAYTVRSVTHLDTFRLEREDLVQELRAHPRAALHVADMLYTVMPRKLAKTVIQEIYDLTELRELLELRSLHGRWRPKRGFAKKLMNFAAENGNELEAIRKRHEQRLGRGNDDRQVLNRLQAMVYTLRENQQEQQRSSASATQEHTKRHEGGPPGRREAKGSSEHHPGKSVGQHPTRAGTGDDVEEFVMSPRDNFEGQRNKVSPPLASLMKDEQVDNCEGKSDSDSFRRRGEYSTEKLMAWMDRRQTRLEAKIDKLVRLVLANNEADEADSMLEARPERGSFRNRRGSRGAGEGSVPPAAILRLRRSSHQP